MAAIARFEKHGTFHKVSGSMAYGWAFASTYKGKPYFDTGDGEHSDHIPEDGVADVAQLFMEQSRVGLDMHSGEQAADVVFAYPMISDIAKGVGLNGDTTGLLIGWSPHDKALLEKVASGERIGFSIGGLVNSYDIVDVDGNVIESINLKSNAGARFAMFGKESAYYDGGPNMKRRVFRSWKLSEISLVDRPMQAPALVGIVKGLSGAKVGSMRKIRTLARAAAIAKSSMLTTADEGHQHLIDPTCCDESGAGNTEGALKPGDDWDHSHAWVRDPSTGAITIATNDGHSHTIEATANPAPSDGTVVIAMRENLPPAQEIASVDTMADVKNDQNANELADLRKSRDGWRTMTDAHRAHVAKLSTEDRDAFVLSTPAQRNETIKAALEADPVVYTSERTKKAYRASEQSLADMAKENDANAIELAKARTERDEARYAKIAADSFGGIALVVEKGKHDDRLALAKAIHTITDEAQRDRIFLAIKGAASALDDEGNPHGVGADNTPPGEDEDDKPAEPTTRKSGGKNPHRVELQKRVAAHMTANKVGREIATAALLKEDDDCKVLYQKVKDWDRAHAPRQN
jgi:hypothetical protein